MSARELNRVEVLGRVKAGRLTLVDAATRLGVSYRQAKRLWRRYKRGGAKALRHRQVGRTSNRGTSPRKRQRALALIREKYSGDEATRFGPTLVAEHLASEDGLTIDHETLRRWMLGRGRGAASENGCRIASDASGRRTSGSSSSSMAVFTRGMKRGRGAA